MQFTATISDWPEPGDETDVICWAEVEAGIRGDVASFEFGAHGAVYDVRCEGGEPIDIDSLPKDVVRRLNEDAVEAWYDIHAEAYEREIDLKIDLARGK